MTASTHLWERSEFEDVVEKFGYVLKADDDMLARRMVASESWMSRPRDIPSFIAAIFEELSYRAKIEVEKAPDSGEHTRSALSKRLFSNLDTVEEGAGRPGPNLNQNFNNGSGPSLD